MAFWRKPLKQPRLYPPLDADHVVYAVGDVHGRADLLARVHAAIDAEDVPDGRQRLEVYLGDYVDRGPNSRRVLDMLIERAQSHRVMKLRGNHEAMFEAFLTGELDPYEWRLTGGFETLMSYGFDIRALSGAAPDSWIALADELVPAEHRALLNSLANSFEIGDYFFAHAGVRPGVPLDEQVPDDLLWIRDEFMSDTSDFGAIVVHGHTPAMDPEFMRNRINIDTGAYLTSRLTCLRIDHEGPSVVDTSRRM